MFDSKVRHDIVRRDERFWLVGADAQSKIVPESEMFGPFEDEEAAHTALMMMYETGLL